MLVMRKLKINYSMEKIRHSYITLTLDCGACVAVGIASAVATPVAAVDTDVATCVTVPASNGNIFPVGEKDCVLELCVFVFRYILLFFGAGGGVPPVGTNPKSCGFLIVSFSSTVPFSRLKRLQRKSIPSSSVESAIGELS